LANLVYTCLALMALIGVAALAINRKMEQPLAWIGVIFGLYWTLLHLPFVGEDRYALPVLPFLAIYAAYGLSSALHLDSAGQDLE
ncbi:MAG TPA: hypothetical protein VFO07_19435, partial [Roseiflexaceae bacterium]|nr:hypothetical protein [Roseiflexaceae bacterium]